MRFSSTNVLCPAQWRRSWSSSSSKGMDFASSLLTPIVFGATLRNTISRSSSSLAPVVSSAGAMPRRFQ